MSRARYLTGHELFLATTPGHCRRCGAKLTGRKTSWCSRECSSWFDFMCSPSAQRAAVERRDGGVCVLCGLDTEALRDAYAVELHAVDQRSRDFEEALFATVNRRRRWDIEDSKARTSLCSAAKMVALQVKRDLVDRWNALAPLHGAVITEGYPVTFLPRSLWEADHIVPVVEGGGVTRASTVEGVLANLRTLCIPCHRRETAALAARRAAERRPQRQLFAGI